MQSKSSSENLSSNLPSVSIVILNWNGKNFLEKFLPSVMATTYKNFSVVVGDNASADDSITFLQTQYPDIEIIKNDTNEGFARGYNLVLQKVVADYYVLLNSDVEVTNGWLQPIISLMEKDSKIAACQPKILQYGNQQTFEYAGASGGWIDKLGYPFARGRIFDSCEKDIGQYNDAVPCFWASGAAMVIRSQLFHKMGGLDDYFFAHQEEIDLCWRLQNAGNTIYVQPASVVFHVGGGTLPKNNSLKTYLNFRNNLVLLYKNMPVANRFYILFLRFFLDSIAAGKELLTGKPGLFLAIVKAWLHFAKWLLFVKKDSNTNKKDFQSLAGTYEGSVVWEYYIKKKRMFSEIVKN